MGGRHNRAVRADNCSPTAEIEERMSEQDEGRDGPRGARIAGYTCEFDARPARRAAHVVDAARGYYIYPTRPGVRRGCKIVPTYRRESPYQAGSSSRRSAQS
jgi:hypothetical protein